MKRNKTIIFVANDRGGIGKSTAAGTIGDALQTLGFTVCFLSGDMGTNLTLRQIQPSTTHYDIKDAISMDHAMAAAVGATEDVVIFDLPGFSSQDAAKYFAEQGYETFREIGLRFVIAVVATQHIEAITGAINWIEVFFGNAETIIFANGSKTPDGEPIDLGKIEGGQDLLEIASGRIVEIPKFSKRMHDLYNSHPAVPTSYFPDGPTGKLLRHNAISASPWRKHHTHVVRSLTQHAEWLTGKAIPKPFDITETTAAAPATNAAFERLKYTKDSLTLNPAEATPVPMPAKKSKPNE